MSRRTNKSRSDSNMKTPSKSADSALFILPKLTQVISGSLLLILVLLIAWWHNRAAITFKEYPKDFDFSPVPNDYKSQFSMSLFTNPKVKEVSQGDLEILNQMLQESILPCSMPPSLLTQIENGTPHLHMQLFPHMGQNAPLGDTRSGKNDEVKVGLTILPYMKDHPHELGTSTRNELFHVMCYQVNSPKLVTQDAKTKQFRYALPFLDEKGEIDEQQYKAYKATLDKVLNKVQHLEMLLALNPNHKYIKTARKIFKDYRPVVRVAFYDPEIDFNKEMNKKNKLGEKLYTPVAVYSLKNKRMVTFTRNLTSLEAFLNDFRYLDFAMYRAPDRMYNLTAHRQDMEIGSSIWELSPEAKQFIADDFCAYMRGYWKLDENPCAIPIGERCSIQLMSS